MDPRLDSVGVCHCYMVAAAAGGSRISRGVADTFSMQGGAKEDLVHLKQVGKACDTCRKDRKILGCDFGVWIQFFDVL
jgi:hypothetical protein